VAHGLQADGIEEDGECGHIVGDEVDLDAHADHDDEQTHNQEADAAIEQDAAHHDERREQARCRRKTRASRPL
jgi:hypothetical protein